MAGLHSSGRVANQPSGVPPKFVPSIEDRCARRAVVAGWQGRSLWAADWLDRHPCPRLLSTFSLCLCLNSSRSPCALCRDAAGSEGCFGVVSTHGKTPVGVQRPEGAHHCAPAGLIGELKPWRPSLRRWEPAAALGGEGGSLGFHTESDGMAPCLARLLPPWPPGRHQISADWCRCPGIYGESFWDAQICRRRLCRSRLPPLCVTSLCPRPMLLCSLR